MTQSPCGDNKCVCCEKLEQEVRIKRWLTEELPAVKEILDSGVYLDGLKALEIAVGSPLPSDLIDFYCIHDG